MLTLQISLALSATLQEALEKLGYIFIEDKILSSRVRLEISCAGSRRLVTLHTNH